MHNGIIHNSGINNGGIHNGVFSTSYYRFYWVCQTLDPRILEIVGGGPSGQGPG